MGNLVKMLGKLRKHLRRDEKKIVHKLERRKARQKVKKERGQ